MHNRVCLSLLLSIVMFALPAHAREWVDSSGHYTFEGELLASNGNSVILEKPNKDLISVEVEQLSEKDQKYLADLEENAKANPDLRTWTGVSGLQFRASVVEFVRRDVNIRRLRGKPYVNDQQFDKLPGVYRRIIPRIISHFEGVDVDEKSIRTWVRKLKGKTKTYTCEGVLLEFENGDLYAVPFFLFSKQDLKVLQPEWEKWANAKDDEAAREQYSLSMRAQAHADQEAEQERRQVAKLQLQLQGYQAGLFALWEVAVYPPGTMGGMPMSIVVPARNSQQARVAALSQFPNYRVGPIRKVPRKY